ncbi:MAG: hypothetical protein GX116_06985 [Fibrobacter sp.]|jgi:hypothetical protein|nr:hypothetical protein [Fibrobacter sp.]
MSETEKKEKETQPQKTQAQEKPASSKKNPAKKKRPKSTRAFKKGAHPSQRAASKASSDFSDSIEDRFPALAAKLKKHVEDGIKRKIKEAQSDPKVQKASAKFGAN